MRLTKQCFVGVTIVRLHRNPTTPEWQGILSAKLYKHISIFSQVNGEGQTHKHMYIRPKIV